MQVSQLFSLMTDNGNTIDDVVVAYEDGIEEDYPDFHYNLDDLHYIEGLKFESFDMYTQDGRQILKIWL